MATADSLENVQTPDEATAQMVQLFKDLSEDPKTRKRLLGLIKEKHPNQPIPELDTESAIAAAAKPYIDKLSALEKKQLEREVSDRIESQRRSLREQGFSADDVKAIEKRMVDEQIPSYETAAKYYKLERTTAQPTPSTFTTPQLPVDKKLIKEAGGIKNWARTEAHKAVEDVRSGRVKLH